MSNFWQPNNLTSSLVILQPLDNKHFTEMYAAASDPLIWEQHPAWNRYQEPVFQQYFSEAVDGGMAFAILDAATNAIIGCSRFYNYLPETSCVSIGYTFLTRAYWGGKYNAHCKQLMIDYAFTQVDTVVFHVGVNNIRSRKAVEKLRAVLFQEELFENNGTMLPHVVYHLQKADWQKLR
jgi:RimJ/RimL family protein N-acetyltransferase